MTDDQSTVPIEFKGRHDHISERMREHASKKLQRLMRYNDRVVRIEVVVDHAHANPEVELLAHMRRGAPMIAKDRGDTFASTIDLVVEKMEKQLKKQKEKRKDHKPRAKGRPGRGGVAGGGKGEETYEEVVRRSLRG
jgi:putative sigma-54 modulation protein